MAKKAYEEAKIRAIANKIREKTKGTNVYKTSQMPTGIDEVYSRGYSDGVESTNEFILPDGYVKSVQNGKRVMVAYKTGDVTDAWYYGDERSTDIANLDNTQFVGEGSANALPVATPNKYGYMGQNMMAYSPYGISVVEENGANVYWFNQAYRTWGRQLRLEANCSYTIKFTIKSPSGKKLSRFCVLNRAEAGELQYNKNESSAFEAVIDNDIVSALVDINVRVGGNVPSTDMTEWETFSFDFTTAEGKPYVDIIFEQMLGSYDYYLKDIQIICQSDTYYSTVTVETEVATGSGDNQLAQLMEGTLKDLVENNATSIIEYFADVFPSIETIHCENVKSVGTYAFCDIETLTKIYFPSIETVGNGAFSGCTSLAFADISNAKTIEGNVFWRDTALATVIIRNNTVCTLESADAFLKQSSAIVGGSPTYLTGITIYVPQALIESYQTATNWSTLYANGSITFVAIEGSEYE